MKIECEAPTGILSRQARARMKEPLFCADWLDVVFLHLEVGPEALQGVAPFELDLWEGMAYVSLVSFKLSGMCTAMLPCVGAGLLGPVSNHRLLNVRTYVRARGEPGIYFLAEWLSKRFPVPLGRPVFGLPYHFARFDCRHGPDGLMEGNVSGAGGGLRYRGELDAAARPAPCLGGSLDEFLLERYTAFTDWRGLRRYFRVWHEPWAATALEARIEEAGILDVTGDWFGEARLVGGHYSPGVRGVWMGRPQFF